MTREQRHKTPAQLLGQMVRILKRWFPDRTFVVTGDGNYNSHELAELAARTPWKWTLVCSVEITRTRPDVAMYYGM